MSLLPIMLDELLENRRQRSHCDLFDQNFGLGLDLLEPRTTLSMFVPLSTGYLRPWRTTSAGNSGVATLQNNQDGFKVSLDVQQFKPEELKVKVVDDYLVIEAKHEERIDEHGYVSREFTRRYKIPDTIDASEIASKLSTDGVLTLEAPKKVPPEAKIREIPITHTNAPAPKLDKQPEKMEDN